MTVDKFFDVLSIREENGNVDMIQSLMGNDCILKLKKPSDSPPTQPESEGTL